MKGIQPMFKKILLITIVLTIALTASVAGLLPDTHNAVDGSSDTVFAARFDFANNAVLLDPDCPFPSSGTGGGC
jgi:hypothetical protein